MKRILLLLLFSTVICFAGQFIAVKQTKTPSRAALKEDIGDLFGSMLFQSFTLSKRVISMQESIAHKMEELLIGAGDSYFAHSSKQDLQKYKRKLESMRLQLKQSCDELHAIQEWLIRDGIELENASEITKG